MENQPTRTGGLIFLWDADLPDNPDYCHQVNQGYLRSIHLGVKL